MTQKEDFWLALGHLASLWRWILGPWIHELTVDQMGRLDPWDVYVGRCGMYYLRSNEVIADGVQMIEEEERNSASVSR